MRVWRADMSEAATVAQLLVAFRDHMDHDSPPESEFLESVEKLIGRDDTEYWLAAADGAPAAGVCQLRFRHSVWTSSQDCWLEDLFVRESARGLGLGRGLVTAAMDRARERGCARIELDTEEGNRAAVSLYESLGFSNTSKSESRGLFFGARL
jgi:ribosomal protein S18 acetylase RimI-like enzyme